MRENFVATISHELRTPVAVLKGSVEVLKDGIITVPHEIDAYYRQMYRETVYLERLVNDLLELSRLQDDRFRLEKDIVSVHQIIQDAARAIRQVARKKILPCRLSVQKKIAGFRLTTAGYGRY